MLGVDRMSTYQPIARLIAAGWQLIAPHWWRHELHGDALTVEALRITEGEQCQ